MSASDAMAERIRMALGPRPDIVEKRIIGGIGFMLDGHLMVGTAAKGRLMVRIDPNEAAAVVKRPGVRPMQMGGRPMDGYITIEDDAILEHAAFLDWLHHAETYVRTLPAK
jgi:TfoX/Sxy family transcriptional regulator of competence genes